MISYISHCPEGEEQGVKRIVLGRESQSKEGFFKEIAKKLDFPEYFGHNWDAFIDCLGDLSWIGEKKIEIVCPVPPLEHREDQQVFQEIVDEAQANLRRYGRELVVSYVKKGGKGKKEHYSEE